MNIRVLSNDSTSLFALEELKKYFFLFGVKDLEDFELTLGFCDKQDAVIDAVEIDVGKNGGYIKGSNPRSLLFGVYRYVEALGVRFVRHGENGEIIPRNIDPREKEVKISHTATQKYRGVCLEGAESLENVLENIDWAAKMGYNVYFIQYVNPYEFFDRWYSHERFHNPRLKNERFTPGHAVYFKSRVAYEIKKRGLVFHDVGHGWTCAPLGLIENESPMNATEENRQLMAIVGGKRGNRSMAQSIQLCYSNPEARRKMTDYCVSYVEEHPEVDAVHFWLADGERNHCECENCIKKRPTDWYIDILNELDEKLSVKGLDTKIVYCAYLDLLWKPVESKFNNPDRFILMIGPIGRDYVKSYGEVGELPDEPLYQRNKMVNPTDIESNVAHLLRIKETCNTEAFTFEYYYWRGGNDHYTDFGGERMAKVISKDIRNFDKVGLCGLVTCQTQRCFLHTGLGQYVMAKTLWDSNADFDAVSNEYYTAAYGNLCGQISNFFKKLSSFDRNPSVAEFEKIKETAKDELEFIKSNSNTVDELDFPRSASVFYLEFYCELLELLCDAEIETALRGYDAALPNWIELFELIRRRESQVQRVFDVFQFVNEFVFIRHKKLKEYKELKA